MNNLLLNYKSIIQGGEDLGESLDSFVKSNNNDLTSSDNLGGVFTGSTGVRLATDGYTPEITKTNITSSISGESPIHEFFKKTTGSTYSHSKVENWYDKRQSPDSEGKGRTGSKHSGIDIHTSRDDAGETNVPLYATTDGHVTVVKSNHKDCGNYIAWNDAAGYQHRYLHMVDSPKVRVGQDIRGGMNGDLIGYIGSTGRSSGPHLHYDITDPTGKKINPLTYFNYVPAKTATSAGTISGNSTREKIWNFLVSSGLSENAAAGLMGCWQCESSNDPDTIEGYYMFDGKKNSPEVKAALSSNKNLSEYTKKIFNLYDKQGIGYTSKYYRGSDGLYYPGLGLAQWTANRTQELLNFANSRNTLWNDLETQLRYAMDGPTEFNSRKAGNMSLLTAMNQAASVDQATELAYDFYENSQAGKHTKDSKNITERKISAKQIYGDYSTSGFNMNSQSTPESDEFEGLVLTQSTPLNFRSSPSLESPVISKIPNGTNLTVTTCKDYPDWYKTTYEGLDGYVSKDYVMRGSGDAEDFDWFGLTGSNSDQKQPIVINKFDVSSNKQAQTERLGMILNNTYNVRSERIEELLERILEVIDKDNKPKSGGVGKFDTRGSTSSLFDNSSIPKHVQKLYS